MQEDLKKATSTTAQQVEKTVTLFIRSQSIFLSGIWTWEMNSSAVYCSDVMSFPEQFMGTKALIHPDDLPKLTGALSLMGEKELPRLDFRIITTYGEVKTITGQRVAIDDDVNKFVELLPGKEPWEEMLQHLATNKENDFLQLRNELTEYTERLHGIGCWLINKSTGTAWYSDNVFRIHDLPPQSLNFHANTFNQFIHPNDRGTVLDAFEKAYQEEVSLHMEYRILLKEEETRYVQQITKWMYDAKGHLIFCGIIRDVTEERAIADELIKSQTFTLLNQQVLKFAEQQSLIGHWHIDLITRKASYSDNYHRIYGMKPGMLPNNSFVNFVHPDDRPKVRASNEKMYREHELEDIEFRIIRPDGKIRHIKQSGRLFINPNKELVMIGIVQDVSVKKGLEKKIIELNETVTLNKMVAELTEAAAEVSSIIWLPDGYMHWSDGFYYLLGYKPGAVEPLSRIMHKSIHPADLKDFREAEASVIRGQEHDDLLVRLITRAGFRQVKISFRQISFDRDASGLKEGVVVGVIHDITRQTALQDELLQNKLYVSLLSSAVNELVLFTNTDNIILNWNKTAEEKTKINSEEALYHNLFDVLPNLNEEIFLSQLHSVMRGNETHSFRAVNAYIKPAHNYWLCPLKNERGEVTGVLHIVQDVSEQLLLQQQLGERLNFIESLVEASVDRIVVLDRFMNYLYWNKKAEEYYAIDKGAIVGKNILEVFPSFRNNPSYQQFRAVLKGETIFLPAILDEETKEYAETYLTPVKDENGNVTAILWIVHDLSNEFELQQKIMEQARYISRITDTIPDMISVMDVETKQLSYLNKETYLAAGYNADDMLLKSGEELTGMVDSNDRTAVDEYYKRLQAAYDSDIIEVEYRAQNFSGQWNWFHTRGKVFQRNKEGEVTHIINVVENITDRKIAEEEILGLKDRMAQQATDKYYSIFNSIDQGFTIVEVLFDKNGTFYDYRFLEVNPAFIKQTGLHNPVGKSIKELAPSHETFWFEMYGEIAKTGEPKRFEHFVQEVAGGVWYDVYAFRIDEPEQNRVAALFSDITERKRLEERQQFLLAFSDALRNISDPYQIKIAATRLLGEHLKVDRVQYHEIDPGGEWLAAGAGYSISGQLHEGRVRMDDFGGFVKTAYLAGQTLKVMDTETDPHISTEERIALKAIGVCAFVAVPIIKQGRFMGTLGLDHGESRAWLDCEISLSEEVAERTWAAVERATAEEALRQSEEGLKNFNFLLEQQVRERTRALQQSTEEIRKNLAILSQAEDIAAIGSWEYDLGTSNFIWSDGMYKLFGLSKQIKVQPEIYFTNAVEEDRRVARRIVNSITKKGVAFEEKMRIKRNNDQRMLMIKASVVNDENGKAQKIIGVDIDITDIQKAEEELKKSEHWLEQTSKASPDSITIYDLQTKQPVYLNNCLGSWIGLSNDDLVKMGAEGRLQLIHPDDRLTVRLTNEKTVAAKDGEIIAMEYRVRTNSGKIIWLRNRSKPFLRDASGKVTHLLSVLQNVTDEVELREQLKQRTEFAEAILDASVDRITVFDRDYKFVGWNKRCEQIHRKTKGEVIGKTIFELFPDVENYPEFMDSQEKAIHGEFVHVPVVKDGYTGDDLELFYIPLKNENGETYAVVNVMHDISDFVLNTQALNIVNKKLESKNLELEQKNEEITSFAFVASHDMKEPLRKIHTFSDWLMEQEIHHLSDKGKSLVEKINASVLRMEFLIEDILVLTKIHSDSHKEEEVNLNVILRNVVDEMSEKISQTSTSIKSENLPMIKGNHNQLFYLFKNLISNAIKFQKPGSLPQVVVTSEIVNNIEVTVPVKAEEYLKLSFTDNGFGFDQRYAKKIFQVFQRLHGRHEFEGTGIGLAICKKIMENHNGAITVQSEQGKGSVFSCFFPLH